MRSLIRMAIHRPVGTSAFFILVLALAGLAFVRMPVALLPDLDYPALAVWTAYPEAGAQEVEEAVTRPVEGAVAGVGGVESITAKSQIGGSLIRLRFGWEANMDRKALEVREQLARLGEALPEEARRPLVLQIDPSQRPVMMIGLQERAGSDTISMRRAGTRPSSSPQDLTRLRQVGEQTVARRLEQLPGIARVQVTGGFEQQVGAYLRESAMSTYNISTPQIRQALEAANVALPGGVVRRGPYEYAVEVTSEYQNPEDVAETIIARPGSTAAVRLSDLAIVRETVQKREGFARLNGQETLLLLVERTAGANTVQAAAQVREALTELRDQLPQTRLEVIVDESTFIENAISATAQAVWLGGLLAVVVLFGFLRRWRAVLAVGIAVPLSLALTFIAFDVAGVTFNLIALGGLALGVGMLVDNGIIVTENIARLREAGMGPKTAALEGTAEVSLAITASTFTTIAVFGPITFVEGLAGRLFTDQSLAVIFSLLASLVVAFTAVPAIASGEQEGAGREGPRPDWLYSRYERGLQWCLTHKGWVLLGSLITLIGAGLLAYNLPREVMPPSQQGRLEARLRLPPEASLPLVSDRSAGLEEELIGLVGVRHVLAEIGRPSQARLTLDPRPGYAADFTVVAEEETITEARDLLRSADLPRDTDLEIRPVRTRLGELLTHGGGDLLIDLISENRSRARAAADSLLSALESRPELTGLRRAAGPRAAAYRIRFKRDALARSEVSAEEITAAIQTATRGIQATALRQTTRQVPILLHSREEGGIRAMLDRTVSTPRGPRPLGQFISAERTEIPAELLRSEQAPVVRLVANIAPGADLQSAVGAVEEGFTAALPGGVRGEVGGANQAFREGLWALALSLLLSVLLVYLILAAQFESLVEPLVIMAAVPLAAAGVALVLALTGQSINLMSLTGCVVLVGIVVNDAIVKVDFIDRRRAKGKDLQTAILEAGRQRFRPILMTTVTTALGLLPLALAIGEGAELRSPLAIAIVGGLLSATVLTLFVVPVLYGLAARIAQ